MMIRDKKDFSALAKNKLEIQTQKSQQSNFDNFTISS